MSELFYQYQLPIQVALPKTELLLEQPIDIENKLRHLLSLDLTFNGKKTNYATHSMHAFAAKFPPQLPQLFINHLTRPGEIVLDPMVGSGTVLVEALLAGRKAVGVDLDPLALLITRVKSKPLNLIKCYQAGKEVLESSKRNVPVKNLNEIKFHYDISALNFFSYWFEATVIEELAALIHNIKKVEDADIRQFLEMVFSSIIITKSAGLTLARDLAHSRPHRDLNRVGKINQSAFDAFAEKLQISIEALRSIAYIEEKGAIVRADVRKLPLADNSIDLVVTSPPYAANAIDYMRAHKFSLIWLGYSPDSLSELRRKYIGAELKATKLDFNSETANQIIATLKGIDENRARIVAHYYADMEVGLAEMLRVLNKGKAAILVIGSSVIKGVDIKAPTVLAELAEAVGFNLVGIAKREILRNARMMPTSHASERNGIEARMHEEGVIGLVKPK